MAHSQWIRWQVGYRTAPRTLRLRSPLAILGYPMLCAWAKGQGCLEDGIPAEDLDSDTLAFILGGCSPAEAQEALDEWLRVGYLRGEGPLLIIPSARKWHPDRTAAERMRRYRERLKSKDDSNCYGNDRSLRVPDRTGLEKEPPHSPPTGGRTVKPKRFRKRAKGPPVPDDYSYNNDKDRAFALRMIASDPGWLESIREGMGAEWWREYGFDAEPAG